MPSQLTVTRSFEFGRISYKEALQYTSGSIFYRDIANTFHYYMVVQHDHIKYLVYMGSDNNKYIHSVGQILRTENDFLPLPKGVKVSVTFEAP